MILLRRRPLLTIGQSASVQKTVRVRLSPQLGAKLPAKKTEVTLAAMITVRIIRLILQAYSFPPRLLSVPVLHLKSGPWYTISKVIFREAKRLRCLLWEETAVLQHPVQALLTFVYTHRVGVPVTTLALTNVRTVGCTKKPGPKKALLLPHTTDIEA